MLYCIDVVKVFNVLIFYVNGDDVEVVVYVCEFVVEWCYKFKVDVVVDIVCYCRFGYNEIDEFFFM